MKAPLLLAILFTVATAPLATARTFTDDKGGTTEAELSAVVGDEVILQRSGVAIRWPIARLSPEDQAFVKEWQADPPATPRLLVQMWDRQGLSPAGTFGEKKSSQPALPNIPGVLEIQKQDTFHYYDVDISNPSTTQANQLSLAYQLYVFTAGGGLVVETGTEVLPAIDPKKVGSAATKAISSTRTKSTTLSLIAGSNGGVSTGKSRSRTAEQFAGGWVRIYAQDGKVVGEAKKLHLEVENTDPAWVGPTVAEGSKVKSLDEFDTLIAQVKERLQNIQDLLKSLPPLPSFDSEKPKPPLPPGFPKPPGS